MANFGAAAPTMPVMGTNDKWTTRMGQCDDSAPMPHWLCSIFCLPCGMAKAKSTVDGSHPCYNVLCWTPVGTTSYVRLGYGIKGECGEDCAKALLCPCCNARQVYSEAELRGALRGDFGLGTNEWKSGSLFACTAGELCMAIICPCLVVHKVRSMLQPGSDTYFDCCCILPTAMYGLVRNTYGLTSECPDFPCLEDILVPLVCYPCALARARREADLQKTPNVVQSAIGGVRNAIVGAAGKYAKV
jgi:hypothetical protein